MDMKVEGAGGVSLERTTQEWQALDSAHHLHPYTDPKVINAAGTRVITRADGVYVWDNEGNKILDGMAGLWCVNVGYGRRELVEAAARQMETLPYYNAFFGTSTPTQIELGRKLAEITPDGLNTFFFANSGSEANDSAIRLVRRYWRIKDQPTKRIFIGRNYGYHGSTLATSSLGGMSPMHVVDGQLLPEFAHINQPQWYVLGGDMDRDAFGLKAAQELEAKILELGAENVAAFVGEPVQGAGGGIDPPVTYWPEIQRICRKYDVLLIADEVICGFGRLGEWFGSQAYGIAPDLMPMAKGLSSGYQPIAALALHDRVAEVLNEGGNIQHGYTYSGHPVAAAVALANLEIFEREGLVERVREDIGPYFRNSLQQLADAHPIVGELRGAGLLGALQLVKDRATRDIFPPEEEAALRARDFALEDKLIMRPAGRQTVVLSPPLVITRDEVDLAVERVKRALDRTAQLFGLA